MGNISMLNDLIKEHKNKLLMKIIRNNFNIEKKIKNISDPNLSSKNVPKLYLQEKTIQGRIFI